MFLQVLKEREILSIKFLLCHSNAIFLSCLDASIRPPDWPNGLLSRRRTSLLTSRPLEMHSGLKNKNKKHNAFCCWQMICFLKKNLITFFIFYVNQKFQLYVLLVMEVSSVYSIFAAGADLSESLGL